MNRRLEEAAAASFQEQTSPSPRPSTKERPNEKQTEP